MVEYTIYEPRYVTGNPVERGEQLAFVKDGFHWWAALVPAVWLMLKGLWLEFFVCLAVIAALSWGLGAIGVNESVTGALLLIAQIVFGFEAGTVESAALERKGWRRVGWIEGRSLAECEHRFFAEWLPANQHAAPNSPDTYAGPTPKGPLSGLIGAAVAKARDAASRLRPGSGPESAT